jgi:hypothetical protein
MADAMRSLANGDMPDIPAERAQQLVDNVVPDPAHEPMADLHAAAREELPGFESAAADIKPIEMAPEEVPPPKVEPEPVDHLELRARALEPQIDALSREQALAALEAIGEAKARTKRDPWAALKGQHPDDAETALSAVGIEPASRAGTVHSPLPPEAMDSAPVGAWVEAGFPDIRGTPLYQVREVPLSKLRLPELDENGQLAPEKRGYLPEYTARARAGEQPPHIHVVEMDDGGLRVVDGHRRVLAAKEAGRNTITAAVGPLADTPEGRVPFTAELARSNPNAADSIRGPTRPAPSGAVSPNVPLDDFHGSMLDHLVHNYGDERYVTEDGREVSYRELANEMQKQRNEADSFAKLHDVAAACAARNGV